MSQNNLLVLDTNKWLKLVEEIGSPRVAKSWRDYLRENDFDVVFPSLVLKEIVRLLTRKDNKNLIWKNKEKVILNLMRSGKVFGFSYVNLVRSWKDYHSQAESIIKRYKIETILKRRGLYKNKKGKRFCALHTEDLGILLALKEFGKPYYFITHDNGLLEAVKLKEIRDILVKEGIKFILLHETQEAKNRKVTRIKVLPY